MNLVGGNYWGSAVDTAEIADNAVTLAKMEDGTQGDVYYCGAAGAPSRLAAGTAGKVLQSNGAGANPSWESSGAITLLGTHTLGAAANALEVTGLTTTDYTFIKVVVCSQSAAGANTMTLQLNSDTGNNYTYCTQQLESAAVTENRAAGTSGIMIAKATTSVTSVLDCMISNVASIAKGVTGNMGQPQYTQWICGGSWANTADTITAVKIGGSANFVAGSVMKIYGCK